jgi:histidinol phosphatase-like enzyme
VSLPTNPASGALFDMAAPKRHQREDGAGAGRGRIDAPFYCPHRPSQLHLPKPKPGMFEDIARRFTSALPACERRRLSR